MDQCFKCGKILANLEAIYLNQSFYGILKSKKYYCEKCILEYDNPIAIDDDVKMKTIFLDRDGVINKDYVDYVYTIKKFEFLPNTLEAIKLLCDNGFNIIVITNQSGIARKVFKTKQMREVHEYITKCIQNYGGNIKAFYWCPHDPKKDNCLCRKPKPGMILQAAKDYDINLSESYFVGDWLTDIQCGKMAGCKTILVKTGGGKKAEKELKKLDLKPDYIVEDLLQAAKIVVEENDNEI